MGFGDFMKDKLGKIAAAGGSLQAASPEDQADIADALLDQVKDQRPDPKDFRGGTNEEGLTYSEAMIVWTEQLAQAADTAGKLREFQYGTVTLPDGRVVATGDAPPELLQAITTANQQAFQKLATDFQLDSYKLESEKAQADFNNQISVFNAKRGLDQDRLSSAEAKIARKLDGMAESRSRADTVTRNILDAAPYMTSGGKTSFSPNEVGSIASGWASRLGLDPSRSILNFTGTQTIDPEGLMRRYDSEMGVGGILDAIPEMGLSEADIPGLPQFRPPSLAAPILPSAPMPAVSETSSTVTQGSSDPRQTAMELAQRMGMLLKDSLFGGNRSTPLTNMGGQQGSLAQMAPGILDSARWR